MELELKFKAIDGLAPSGDLVVTHEETMETVIPEYCPDLARIVDTVGRVWLREKETSEGRLSLGGTIRVTVLYTSGEAPGLRSLTLSLPFTCRVEDKRGCQIIDADGRLLLLEAKMLGYRKLYVRALPEFRVKGYRRDPRRLCVGAEGEAGLQLRRDQAVMPLLTDVWEREFTIAQELTLEGSGSDGGDLVMYRPFLQLSGCQRFGNKLVVRGDVILSLLLRNEAQQLERREVSAPFSQIIDGDELPENATFSCGARVVEEDVHPVRTEDGSGFSLTMRVAVTVRTYQEMAVDYVSDLYSTRLNTVATRQAVSIPEAWPPTELRREVRQQLEGCGAFAYMTDASVTVPEITTGEENRPAARCGVHMKVLYLDEAGTPVVSERSCEVSGEAAPQTASVASSAGPELWQQAGSGYEVRLPVTFRMDRAEGRELIAVTSAQLMGEIDRSAMPSLILRRLQEGESLWDVAKQCRTEEQAILAANNLQPGQDVSDMMLLIPKVR